MDVFHSCRGGDRGCIRPTHLDAAPAGARIRQLPDTPSSAARKGDLANRLHDERRARRVSAPEFARELGVAFDLYRDWELGRRFPTAAGYQDLERRLGWDGHLRRYTVLVALERTVEARSAGEAASSVLAALEIDGRPLKAEVIRTSVKP